MNKLADLKNGQAAWSECGHLYLRIANTLINLSTDETWPFATNQMKLVLDCRIMEPDSKIELWTN